MDESGKKWRWDLFTGEYRHTLDEKKRLILPARLRKELRKKSRPLKTVVSRGYDGCLFLFHYSDWEKYLETELRKERDAKIEIRNIKRYFTGSAAVTEIDKSGRILIPSSLKNWAKIKNDVILLGVIDRIEIWCPGRWEKLSKNIQIEKLAENLVSGLAG